MHEMSLAGDVVDTVVETAEASGAEKVLEVHMTVGEGRDIVEDLFEGLFSRLCKETIAEGAKLVFAHVPLMVCCRECSTLYPINVFDKGSWLCPYCGQKKYALYSGMEFTIDKVIVDFANNPA